MRIISGLKRRYAMYKGGETYINFLRSQGVTIGNGCSVGMASTLNIDCSRPYLVEIGNYVRLNKGLTIMTHDFTTMVFKTLYGEMFASSGRVKIGNNVYFGQNCTVLKGVTIGDNCIIGYGSIVMNDIPSNSVAVGSPAKVICTIDKYYDKRRVKSLEEALELARIIKEKKGRMPIPSDFREEFVYFCSGDDFMKYPEIPIEHQLNALSKEDSFERWRRNHKAPYASFEDFLKAAGVTD